jgi:hypothetical protein
MTHHMLFISPTIACLPACSDTDAIAAGAAGVQMQTSLAALTAEQQERSARMHQLMEQLQVLASDKDRAAAELLGVISEQVTALQQSTAEELQEVGRLAWSRLMPESTCERQQAESTCKRQQATHMYCRK